MLWTEKTNILITHGTLDGASLEEKEYNSIPRRMLEEKEFDYIALGHIHKTNYSEDENIAEIKNGVISTISSYDIIYDMKSSDSSVNFGFTSGVKDTALVTTKFKDYHYLDVVVVLYPNGSTNTGGWSRVFRMDLTSNPVGSDWLIAGYTCAYSDASAAGYVNKVAWNLVLLYNPSGNGIHCRCSFNGTSSSSKYKSSRYLSYLSSK